MTSASGSEYRQLELDSSNLLLEADRWGVLGRYELSAYAMLGAARLRLRMGQIVFSEADPERAVADWLSAADCFLRASDEKRAEVPLDIVRRVCDEGRIPPGRKDLLQAISDRKMELSNLKEKTRNFLRGLAASEFRLDSPNRGALTGLLGEVRDLPGYAQLHYLIYREASGLGDRELAAFHIHWAATFEPNNPNYAALLGYECIALGKSELALTLGREFLVASPETPQVRIMVASALATTGGNRRPDRLGAIQELLPIIGASRTPVRQQVAAMALCAVFHHELGHRHEAEQLLDQLSDIAYTTGDREVLQLVSRFRQMQPPEASKQTESAAEEALQWDRDSAFAAARELAFA